MHENMHQAGSLALRLGCKRRQCSEEWRPRSGCHIALRKEEPAGMTTSAGGKALRTSKRGSGLPPVVDRITVALIRRAAEDLQRLHDRTGLSKTDIVNRAISVYEFVDSESQAGNNVYVRDHKT